MYEKIESLLDDFYKTYYKIEEINLNQVIKCLEKTVWLWMNYLKN